MTSSRIFTALVAAALFAAPALAQTPKTAAPAAAPATPDDTNQVSELVVVAHPQGPAMWQLKYGQAEMTIMGAVSPIAQQQRWDRRPLLAAMEGARLVLLPPKSDLGPLQVMSLMTANVWKARIIGDVEPRMPADLRARFVRDRMEFKQPASRYAHWKPAVAGFLLLTDARHYLGLSMGKPGTTVAKLAKERNIRTDAIGSVSALALFKLATQLDEKQNMSCLGDFVDQAEQERDQAIKLDAVHMNDDWARGDVLAVNARYRLPPVQRCLMMAPGAHQVIEREMTKGTERLWAELQKPGKTVAVIDMAWLLPRDGVLDRLKAKGATVGEPPQVSGPARTDADDDKD